MDLSAQARQLILLVTDKEQGECALLKSSALVESSQTCELVTSGSSCLMCGALEGENSSCG